MTDLNADLLAQVDKHLPQMVGEQLRVRLALADKADEALVACEKYAQENGKLRAEAEHFDRERARLVELDRVLGARERVIDLKELELKLKIEHAEKFASFASNTIATVFKNREIVQRLVGDVPVGVGNQPGGYPMAMTAPVNQTTTSEG